MSLWDSLVTPVSPEADLITWEDRQFRRRSWADLITQAEGVAATLRRRGVEPGSRVGCVLSNTFEAGAALLGIWWAGGVVISYPGPARGISPADYLGQLAGLYDLSGASMLVIDDELASGAQVDGGPLIAGFGELTGGGRLEPSFAADDDMAFVQYSSGSTSAPKGCILTPRAIAAQLHMIADRLEFDQGRDRAYSWLPLSHDMGLFGGFLSPWAAGVPLTLSTPTRFLRSPHTWLDDCAAGGSTITVGPSFGLSMVLRAVRRRLPAGSLSLRSWVIGSDPIEAAVLSDAIDLLRPVGLKRSSFRPAYGLAEATLVVTMTRPDSEPDSVPLALEPLYSGELRAPAAGGQTAAIVSVGPPAAGAEVRIDGPGEVGEILVRSPSVAAGYLGDPGRSARSFPEAGTLRTGDLGFLRDGELYVIGREDDMMSVGGRNIYTSAVEARLGGLDSIHTGCCALVDVTEDGRRYLAVVAEPADDGIDFMAAARSVREVAAAEAGVGISECVFVARGALPKSPSGKIQRFRCRTLAVEGGPSTLARVRVG